MDNIGRIKDCCDIAIRKGFGDYFVFPNLTWAELKHGLDNGLKLTAVAQKQIQISIEELSRQFRKEDASVPKGDSK